MRIASIAVAAAVLFAPASLLAQGGQKQKKSDIVSVASSAGQFTTLVAAIKAAGLVETLQGKGPFTVFAPTDEAFAKLPKGTIDALLANKEKLAAILTYHVVPGKLMAADIVKMGGATPATVNGDSVDITLQGGKVYIDGSRIVSADIGASNGVIHVIDAVILPGTPKSGSR